MLNDKSDIAIKRANAALEIHKTLEDRAAVVSEEGREAPRDCIAVVPIATYISASGLLCLAIFRIS